jgi:hypothetical protein
MRLLSLLVFLPLIALAQQPAPPPLAFHVEPYLQLPRPDSMTIMWETTQAAPSRVEYGPTPQLGMVKEEPQPVKLHQVRLEELQAGTAYYYRVQSDTLVSKVNRFRTAPTPGTGKWKMAVYGDSRSNPTMHRRVVDQIAKHDVDLILHTGDIVLNGKNYQSWRVEFFGPVSPIMGSVPWVSTIGNHEQDAVNYFSYAALPGNERHYGFDFGNAHFVCLDSNGWIPRTPGSPQFRWAEEHLKKPREATWTFVFFHHPLFSAHARRAINPLRWDWAPLFLDPANKVDGVLNGHDHFYARNHRIAKITEQPHPVFFMTSAGGGAALYPLVQRDYIAAAKATHHFTLMEFDGPKITLSAIDVNGTVFDRHTLTKERVPAEELCSFEVEEVRELLRQALRQLPPLELAIDKASDLRQELVLPTRFGVPIAGTIRWEVPDGWRMSAATSFVLQPGDLLRIPLTATVSPAGLGKRPKLRIEFAPGKFRNRIIEALPFKLTANATTAQDAALPMLPVNGTAAVPLPTVRVSFKDSQLLVQATLPDPEGKIKVSPATEATPSSRLVRMGEHVRLEVAWDNEQHSLALSPDQRTHLIFTDVPPTCEGHATKGEKSWQGRITVTLPPDADRSTLRFNVVYYHEALKQWFELRPTFAPDARATPEEILKWEPGGDAKRFSRLSP